MSEKPSSSLPLPSERGDVPGYAWLEIIKRPSQEAFATAFTEDSVLDASVMPRSIIGAADIWALFDATRDMYETIAFKRETITGSQTYLEWEGVFEGAQVAGVTILKRDSAGLIESIRLYHRPIGAVIAFSAELARRLAGKMTTDPFRRP